MDTNPATNPVAEQPNAAPQEVAPTPEYETNPDTLNAEEQPEGQDPAQLDDSEEVEYEGNRYKVPKAIAPALLRQADYTKKTQEVAETKRTLEARDKQLQEQAQAIQQDFEDHSQLYAARKQLEQFQNVNWSQLESDDPIQAQQLFRQYTMIRDAHNAIAARLQAKHFERTSKSTAEAARMKEQTRTSLARDIPNWSPKTEQELTGYAVKHGYKPEEVQAALDTDARPFRFLHKAFLWDQHVEKLRQAAKAQAPAEPVKPVGGGRVAPQGLHDNLSTEEWMKRRTEQLKRRA